VCDLETSRMGALSLSLSLSLSIYIYIYMTLVAYGLKRSNEHVTLSSKKEKFDAASENILSY